MSGNLHGALLVLVLLGTGLFSQWIAWLCKVPAIILLILAGLLLGPVTGFVALPFSPLELSELVGMGVAIILFEGGLSLRLSDFRRCGHGIGRLTVLGPPLAWIFGTLAAHYIAGFSWEVSWVLGAILIVTGPTVILPLLRQARLNKQSAAFLRWEGIVNDPVGVLFTVITFQYFTLESSSVYDILFGIGGALLCGLLFGGLGGWFVGVLYRRGAVPEHLKAPVLMVFALFGYWGSNLIQHEAGLLSVTVMGLVIGNMQLAELDDLVDFKENLTVVLLSVLFLVIPAQLELSDFRLHDWRIPAFLVAMLFLVRPLSIFLATAGAPMRQEDRVLLSWIAPRGIVAAATAGVFGPEMVRAGYADAQQLLPVVFLVILCTVVLHSASITRLSQKLGLASKSQNGVLLVGASPWTHALALVLKRLQINVRVVDGLYSALQPLRMDSIAVYYGEVLSEHAEDALEIEHLGYVLCATGNDYYNALVCNALGKDVGHHRTLQLPTYQEASHEPKRLVLQRRGYFAFGSGADYETLHRRLDEGWKIQATELTAGFPYKTLTSRLDCGPGWLLLGGISPRGSFHLFSEENPFVPEIGSTVLYFAPEHEECLGSTETDISK